MARVLLITGSSGIAAATARLATERGDVVFVVGKEARECEELTIELKLNLRYQGKKYVISARGPALVS